MASGESIIQPDSESSGETSGTHATGRTASSGQTSGLPATGRIISDRTLYLLCGGGSRRMGRDKALLPFGEGTLLEHQINKCVDAFFEIVLLSGIRRYPVDLRHLPDVMEDAGPLSGLLAALEDPAAHQSSAHTSDTLALMAIDLPEVSTATLRQLATGVIPDGHEALIAEPDASGEETRQQPLLGIYDRSITSRLRDYLQAGRRSVRGFLRQINPATFRVAAAEIRNVNTEAEYRKLTNRP
ncbi:MAG: molybdenum cofactor guanylyltransferase [Balneolaceae bacterium]|nr:MAG: molybdenum cofactor guanylyltransferase [Balneolaceae bacterium]